VAPPTRRESEAVPRAPAPRPTGGRPPAFIDNGPGDPPVGRVEGDRPGRRSRRGRHDRAGIGMSPQGILPRPVRTPRRPPPWPPARTARARREAGRLTRRGGTDGRQRRAGQSSCAPVCGPLIPGGMMVSLAIVDATTLPAHPRGRRLASSMCDRSAGVTMAVALPCGAARGDGASSRCPAAPPSDRSSPPPRTAGRSGAIAGQRPARTRPARRGPSLATASAAPPRSAPNSSHSGNGLSSGSSRPRPWCG